jgi:hypothetical protein
MRDDERYVGNLCLNGEAFVEKTLLELRRYLRPT